MIYIIPFDFCNLASICRYFEFNNKEYKFLYKDESIDIENDIIVIPGVGSFSEGMGFLVNARLVDIIQNFASAGGRIIGVCLGMQLMFDRSEESPGIDGLGLLRGEVKKLPNKKDKVPRIGWDSVNLAKDCLSYSEFKILSEHNYTKQLPADFYFVHSYYCVPKDKNVISGTFKHGNVDCCASIENELLYGLQFHPEKSGPSGYMILNALLDK